jgi:hypothetical protein
MNFFEVNVGKRTRRGSLEVYNRFVIKTELSQNDTHYKMLSKYDGFDIEVNQIQEIKEDVVEQKQEANQNLKVETSKKSKIEMELNIYNLGNEQLENLREYYIEKLAESNKAESELKKYIKRYLEENFYNISENIVNLKDTWENYRNFEFTLNLKGELIEILEEQIKK